MCESPSSNSLLALRAEVNFTPLGVDHGGVWGEGKGILPQLTGAGREFDRRIARDKFLDRWVSVGVWKRGFCVFEVRLRDMFVILGVVG